ncbi:MAG TPA: tetratricopeptide repeat protein [Steroidobacteraceae bacterium]|nr:tetratricopeptide repeat protein [Steroidobacteraceae bacterium]
MTFALYMISGLISLGLIVHCVKTQRNTIWVYVLVMLITFPFVGSLVYFAAEILPDLLRSRTSQRAVRGLRTTLDPEGNLRRFETEMNATGNVASRQRYADELVRLGRAAEALPIYQTCLTGVFTDDPKLLLGYAYAQFAAEQPAAARRTLDELIAKNPDFKSADGHLLYARAAEAEGDLAKALSEYAALAEYYPGAEAGVRYARLLKKSDQGPLAQQTLKALLDRAKFAPAHYRKAQREWLDEAHRELQS